MPCTRAKICRGRRKRRYEKAQGGNDREHQAGAPQHTRIEHLVEQLYDVNRRCREEGKLLRMAESSGIKRSEFLQHYIGSELAADWLDRARVLPARGWAKLDERHAGDVAKLRGAIVQIAAETKLPINEFRR